MSAVLRLPLPAVKQQALGTGCYVSCPSGHLAHALGFEGWHIFLWASGEPLDRSVCRIGVVEGKIYHYLFLLDHLNLYRADTYVRTPRFVGFDPLAWLRPRPATGYLLFPVSLAQSKLAECA